MIRMTRCLAALQSNSNELLYFVSFFCSGLSDLYIRVIIETPRKLNDQQRELLEEFARISGDEVHPLSRNFFDKVKDAFGV